MKWERDGRVPWLIRFPNSITPTVSVTQCFIKVLLRDIQQFVSGRNVRGARHNEFRPSTRSGPIWRTLIYERPNRRDNSQHPTWRIIGRFISSLRPDEQLRNIDHFVRIFLRTSFRASKGKGGMELAASPPSCLGNMTVMAVEFTPFYCHSPKRAKLTDSGSVTRGGEERGRFWRRKERVEYVGSWL